MSIRLDLFIHKAKDKSKLANPFVEIIVKNYSQNDDRISISSECYIMHELEEAIQIINNDLKDIRKKAKKLFNN